ncbi:MAG: hypothetical protein E6Q88_14540 [Lysobacteraceae bacterium]|nr:MAG: hypothetical protein E6Q88_14540 [Xanthomonadaceae bacterium]
MPARNAREFLRLKVRGLAARLRRLARVDNAFVGLRPQDMPHAPSRAHFEAANQRLANVEAQIRKRFADVQASVEQAPIQRVLIDIALVERELDRARRLFGMFFEVFAQRGTNYGPTLSAHDAIAQDCYQAIRAAAPRVFRGTLLKPVCYMEHGYSPATMRRGVSLGRLLGEQNPFPLIRIPWDRDHPWQAVFLHEVAHNLQADLGIWQENRQAVVRRIMGQLRQPFLASVYGRWHKEIWADLAALCLGGPAAAWGMAEFLAHPAPRTMTYRPGGAHPTAFLRVQILAEMLRRMNFAQDAARLERIWGSLYRPDRGHRMPGALLSSARHVIPHVVDETMYQTRRNLAQRAVADIIPFARENQAAIRRGARLLAQRRIDRVELPPRHLLSAASYALADARVNPRQLADDVIGRLSEDVRAERRRESQPRIATVAA